MSITVRGNDTQLLRALVAANNQDLIDNQSTFFHQSQFETLGGDFSAPTVTRPVAAAAVTADVDAWALLNQIRLQKITHFADLIAHDTVVSTATTFAAATDTASAVSLVNDIKAVLNVHFTQAGVHFTDDNTNTITNADATDDPTMQVLVNEIEAKFIPHMASAPAGIYINVGPS